MKDDVYRNRIQDTEYRMKNAGYWILDTGCRLKNEG